MKNNLTYLIAAIAFVIAFSACEDDDDKIYSPKPRGYFKIDFPEKKYRRFDSLSQCSFEIPEYSYVETGRQGVNVDTGRYANANPHWLNLKFPKYKARVNLTHLSVNNNLNNVLEDSRFFALSKHQVKATGIDETIVIRDNEKVYGLVFDIAGNTASSVQFYLTDSTKHFMRGALYFNSVPNIDSLKIVIDFIRADILHLVQTCNWKNPGEEPKTKKIKN